MVPTFVFPDTDDTDEVDIESIVSLLPEPTATGGPKRVAKRIVLNGVDLSNYF